MSRIAQVFQTLKQQGRSALIPYITAGDPDPRYTVSLLHDLVQAGGDILEIGVPFSDPMAEGPTIQRAMERALKHDVSIEDVLAMVKSFRETDQTTPIVLMGYLNPIEHMSYDEFARAAKAAGVDGVLTVDMPPEESAEYSRAMRENHLDTIFLVAPTTTDRRIERIANATSGFIYYVSVKGVTGVKKVDAEDVAANVSRIRAHTQVPVGVGFGIRDAESARAVAQVSDAVVVGSALVSKIAEYPDDFGKAKTSIIELVKSMRHAMDQK